MLGQKVKGWFTGEQVLGGGDGANIKLGLLLAI
jgi:hypothetical protein